MYVMAVNRIVNLDSACWLYTDGGELGAATPLGTVILGKYAGREEARAVLNAIYDALARGDRVFKMPLEKGAA